MLHEDFKIGTADVQSMRTQYPSGCFYKRTTILKTKLKICEDVDNVYFKFDALKLAHLRSSFSTV